MKPGSLIVPILDYQERVSSGFNFEPVIPNPKETYTCKAAYPSPRDKNKIRLEVEESKIYYKGTETLFDASEWREIQDPLEGFKVLAQVSHLLFKPKLLT